jgi:hypothetical protein
MAAALAITSATSASAALIQWDVNGTFASGATASGTVVWNTTTQAFDRWSILVGADSGFAEATYSNTLPGSSSSADDFAAILDRSTAGFNGSLAFILGSGLLAALGNPPVSISFIFFDECRPNCGTRRRSDGGSFTNGREVMPAPPSVIPVPASLPLLAGGMLGLAAMMRRRRSAA